MEKIGGFLEKNREENMCVSPEERVKTYCEFNPLMDELIAQEQATRCMECGIPFCQFFCPVSNVIPEFNDFVCLGKYKEALDILESTNNFPEFTGRVCPAPCEEGCVLNIRNMPVTIKNIELFIVEKGFKEGWIVPKLAKKKRNEKIAIVGSGPSGLACAQELVRKGYSVNVIEQDEVAGGLLVLGIPDYKINKGIVARRIKLLEAEGVKFTLNTKVGRDISFEALHVEYDAVVLCLGAQLPRELSVSSSGIKGVYHAMEWLTQTNRNNREHNHNNQKIIVRDKNILVIGGGDTGADCIGTSIREGARSITQIIRKCKIENPQTGFNSNWPYSVKEFDISTSHEEATVYFSKENIREFTSVCTEFITKDSKIVGVKLALVAWEEIRGKRVSKIINGSERSVDVDVIFLALGFLGGNLQGFEGISHGDDGCVKYDENYRTNLRNVFVAGDTRIGQSLVVTAISEGRKVAKRVEEFLNK